MQEGPLFAGKKFTSWNIKRVAEALCEEWRALGPAFEPDAKTAYSSTLPRISFQGEIRVTIDIAKGKYPAKDFVEIVPLLRLSPDPNDRAFHVLNTLSLGLFMDCLVRAPGPDVPFTIQKQEPWQGSALQASARVMQGIIQALLTFETCFHLLLDDTYEINDVILDSKSLGLAHHLNQVKAYRLAEIYGHPEKLDEAVTAIKRYAQDDTLSGQRLDKLCTDQSAGGMDWLYTSEILRRLC